MGRTKNCALGQSNIKKFGEKEKQLAKKSEKEQFVKWEEIKSMWCPGSHVKKVGKKAIKWSNAAGSQEC